MNTRKYKMQKILMIICAVIGFSAATNVYACDGKDHKTAAPTAPTAPAPAK
jgi:hypothetical protein